MTTTMKLYEITTAMEAILEMVDAGEEGWEAALRDLQGAFADKAESIIKVLRMLAASAEAKAAESNRLLASSKSDTAAANRLKSYLRDNMEELHMEHLETTLFKLRLQNSPPRVFVADAKDVPMKYLRGSITLPWERVHLLGLTKEAGEPLVDRQAILENYRTTGQAPQGTEILQGKALYIR